MTQLPHGLERNEQEAWRSMLAELHPWLINDAMRCGTYHDALDAIQDTLFDLFRRIDDGQFEVRSAGQLRSFLRRGVRQRLIDRSRKENGYRRKGNVRMLTNTQLIEKMAI